METVFGILVHDLKKLVRNPVALAVIVAIIVLPSVCAWYSVSVLWNPYSHVDGLKVAVVNNDAGAYLKDVREIKLIDAKAGDKRLDVGAITVEAIKRNHDFDWQIVDAEQGRSGLESGEYHAQFVLPETFTEDVLSVLSGNPGNPTIECWVNGKYGSVALEVTDAGTGVVDAVINRVFSGIIADTMASIVKDVAGDIALVASSSNPQAQQGLLGAGSDVRMVVTGMKQAQAAIGEWQTATADAKDALAALRKTTPDLKESLESATTLLADVRTTVHAANSAYAGAMAEGGQEFKSLLSDISSRVKKASASIVSQTGDVETAIRNAESALVESEKLIATLKKLDPDSSTIASLERQTAALRDEVERLGTVSTEISEAADAASESSGAIADDIDAAIDDMKGSTDDFNRDILPQLDTALDSLAGLMGSLDGALASLDSQTVQTENMLDELGGVLQKTRAALDATLASLDEVASSLSAAQSDLASLAGSDAVKHVDSIADIDVKSHGAFAASPVKAEFTAVYPLNSYGAGAAPFFTSLSIWVACFMLIAIFKLEVDPRRFLGMRPWHGYVARLALFLMLALLQSAVVTIGDLVLGVEAFGSVSFVVAGLVAAFCFINIVYALAVTFKHVGKALAVILLVLQIPGAVGMYPIQLMPALFQALRPWLPFTYSTGAMREAIGGFYGNAYLVDLAWLFACGLAAIALALIVRPAVRNGNRLFDRRLAAADVFITEEQGAVVAVAGEGCSVNSPVESELGRMQPQTHAAVSSKRYTAVKQAAPIAVVALIVALGILSSLLNLDADGKLAALVAFVVAVVVVFCVCVAFEYANDNRAADLSAAGGGTADALAAGSAAAAAAAPIMVPIPYFEPGSWGGAKGVGDENGADDEFEDASELEDVDELEDAGEFGNAGKLGGAGELDGTSEFDEIDGFDFLEEASDGAQTAAELLEDVAQKDAPQEIPSQGESSHEEPSQEVAADE